MIIYDYIFLLIVLIFTFVGFLSGIIKTSSKFFCLLIPFFISYIGTSFLNKELINRFDFYSGTGSSLITSLIIYISFYFLLKLFFLLIEGICSYFNLTVINKISGLIVGFIGGTVIGYFLLTVVNKIFDIQTIIYSKIQSYLSFFLNI